jgi:AGZA family xanthine/uracil permease-like MFS transporter
MNAVFSYFQIEERGTTIGTEVRAGVVTFLTMAYILFVNPQILSQAGMPASDVTIATALGAALATLVMGLYANYPFALAPGMGLNAYFTFGVVLGMGVSWQVALTAVFIEGVLFLLLSVGGLRTALINAIPATLKTATMAGIGLFLALIGLENAGVVVDNPATLVTLGSLHEPGVLLSLIGLIVVAVLIVRDIKGALLIGIVGITLTAWLTGLVPTPSGFFELPHLPRETLLAFDFSTVFTGALPVAVVAFLFVDLFDTAGTLIGVSKLGGFMDENDQLPRADRAFTADAVGTIAGAALGTSTVTAYIESATGIEEGGRTGLTAVVTAGLFLLALFFTPVFTAVPAMATAPALVLVGVFMMKETVTLDWTRLDEAVPAFLTIVLMPFTYSIATGITFGLMAFVLIKIGTGRWSEVNPVLYGVTIILLIYYIIQG